MRLRRVRRALARGLGVCLWGLIAAPVFAADAPLVRKAPLRAASFDWSGFYGGGHVGYARGSTTNTLSDPTPQALGDGFGSLYGGVQGGYNHVLPSGFLIGVEGDISFPEFFEDGAITRRTTAFGTDVTDQIDTIATLRARFGYAFGRVMVYGTGGLAWAQTRFLETPGVVIDQDKLLRSRAGWTAGAGVEFALAPEWSARLEYLYDRFGSASGTLPSGIGEASTFDIHMLRLGLNYFFRPGAPDARLAGDASMLPWPVAPENWNVHGQFTLIGQAYPAFRSPYQGTNSLTGPSQAKNTTSATAFIGFRPWDGTEFYVNPELMQGFGLSDTFGLGAYSNGEAQKSGFPVPRLNIARIFVRQTFGLGGEQEKIEDGPNQLAGKQDISRITITAGKMSVIDYFDGNSYAHDPRTNFMNWNMYCCGSYDLTMDKVGYTWGAFAELNQKYWAFRAGYFLVPVISNDNRFDTNIPDRGEYIAELELRYCARRAARQAAPAGVGEPRQRRQLRGGRGLADGLGELSRHCADAARSQQLRFRRQRRAGDHRRPRAVLARILECRPHRKIGWTEADESVSLGGVLKGTAWGRPNDKVGLGGVVDGLSPEARAYFAAGGLGILIGDGALNYRPERVLEAFYAYSVNKWVTVTFDYQFIVNPAYNADRGPVSIFGTRCTPNGDVGSPVPHL